MRIFYVILYRSPIGVENDTTPVISIFFVISTKVEIFMSVVIDPASSAGWHMLVIEIPIGVGVLIILANRTSLCSSFWSVCLFLEKMSGEGEGIRTPVWMSQALMSTTIVTCLEPIDDNSGKMKAKDSHYQFARSSDVVFEHENFISTNSLGLRSFIASLETTLARQQVHQLWERLVLG